MTNKILKSFLMGSMILGVNNSGWSTLMDLDAIMSEGSSTPAHTQPVVAPAPQPAPAWEAALENSKEWKELCVEEQILEKARKEMRKGRWIWECPRDEQEEINLLTNEIIRVVGQKIKMKYDAAREAANLSDSSNSQH